MNTVRSPQVQVEITAEIIRDAKERDSSHCMIAEAIKAAFPRARNVSVDLQTIRFSDPKRGLRYTYLTPRVGQIALIDFDQGVEPEPLTFTLRRGQVTAAGTRKKRQQSDAALESRRRNAARARELAKAKLVSGQKTDNGEVPDKIGGRTPPTTPFARRRAFGLRALER